LLEESNPEKIKQKRWAPQSVDGGGGRGRRTGMGQVNLALRGTGEGCEALTQSRKRIKKELVKRNQTRVKPKVCKEEKKRRGRGLPGARGTLKKGEGTYAKISGNQENEGGKSLAINGEEKV